MPKFHKSNAKELKTFIYNSYYLHDSKLKSIEYAYGKDEIKIELFNPIYKVKINMIFQNLELVFAIKGYELGNHDEVLSLTLEEDLSCLNSHLLDCKKTAKNYLYLLFEMFSGNKLHIVSQYVIISTEDSY